MLSRTINRIGAGQRLVEFSGPVALEQHPPIPLRARSDLPSCLLLDLPARVGGGLRALLGPTRLRQNRTKRSVAPGLMLISIDLRGSGRLRVMAPGVISAARARRACLVVLGTARPFLRPAAGGPLSSKNGPAFDAVCPDFTRTLRVNTPRHYEYITPNLIITL